MLTVLICVVAFTLEPFHIRIMKLLPKPRKLGPAWLITITRDTAANAARTPERQPLPFP